MAEKKAEDEAKAAERPQPRKGKPDALSAAAAERVKAAVAPFPPGAGGYAKVKAADVRLLSRLAGEQSDDDPTGKIVNALAAGAAEAMRRRETVEVFQKPEELRALLEAAGV